MKDKSLKNTYLDPNFVRELYERSRNFKDPRAYKDFMEYERWKLMPPHVQEKIVNEQIERNEWRKREDIIRKWEKENL